MSSIIAKNEPSIFISHVFPNKADKVETVFLELFGSCIDKVDIVKHKTSNGEDICRAYVHFKWWPNTPEACTLREKLLNGDSIKVVYEEPWFWKCVASKLNGKTTGGSGSGNTKRSGPYIEVGEEHINRVVEDDRERERGEYRGPPRGPRDHRDQQYHHQREYRGPPREYREQYHQRDYEPREHREQYHQREYRGPPREHREQYHQREYRGPQREYRGPPREYRGPPREHREHHHHNEQQKQRTSPPRIIEESSAAEESKSASPSMVPRQVRVAKNVKIVTSNWDKESTDDEGETIPPQPKFVRQTPGGASGSNETETETNDS